MILTKCSIIYGLVKVKDNVMLYAMLIVKAISPLRIVMMGLVLFYIVAIYKRKINWYICRPHNYMGLPIPLGIVSAMHVCFHKFKLL